MKTAPEKIYVGELMSEVVFLITEPDSCKPKLPDIFGKPNKEEVIKKSYSRFRS